MDPAVAAEALRQVWEGYDFPAPASLLKGIENEQAGELPPGFKYSLLTLVEHAYFWQRIWLGQITGTKKPDMLKDWRVPATEEWPEVRSAFLDGLQEALKIAGAEPFEHKLKSDDSAISKLLKIAVHDAYHIGQFVLVKRAVRGLKDADG